MREAFEAIWGTEDLITSYDGGNAFRPWEARPDWKTQGGWWHCDQNGTRPARSGLVCVQGLVLLTPANEYTGGFCVIPGSHRDHEAFSHRHPYADRQGDFLPVPEDDPILTSGKRMVLLRADAGDLILWDSRTIHCNGPALRPPMEGRRKGAAVPSADALLRLVGYVCCTPAKWCPPSVMAKRAKAALEMTTSTHWPHAFVPTGYRPPWWKARTPADFTSAEVRLILGDKGAWPGQPTPRKSLSMKTPAVAAGSQQQAEKASAAAGSSAAGEKPLLQSQNVKPLQPQNSKSQQQAKGGRGGGGPLKAGLATKPPPKSTAASNGGVARLASQPRAAAASAKTSAMAPLLPAGPVRRNSKSLLGRFFSPRNSKPVNPVVASRS